MICFRKEVNSLAYDIELERIHRLAGKYAPSLFLEVFLLFAHHTSFVGQIFKRIHLNLIHCWNKSNRKDSLGIVCLKFLIFI
jgi:hypothetical protein